MQPQREPQLRAVTQHSKSPGVPTAGSCCHTGHSGAAQGEPREAGFPAEPLQLVCCWAVLGKGCVLSGSAEQPDGSTGRGAVNRWLPFQQQRHPRQRANI